MTRFVQFHILLLGALVALVLLAAGAAQAQDRTYITSEFTDAHFATIANRGGLVGAAAPDHARAAAFEMIRLDGNRFAFRDLSSGEYLRAGVGQGTHMMITSPHARGWETFEMIGLTGAVALRSIQNGLFLTVEPGDAGLISATAEVIGARERFMISTISAAPEIPVAQGRVELAFSYAFDLDSGRTSTGAGDDLWFQAGNGGVFLSPLPGALLGPVTSVPLTVEACRARGFTPGRVDLRDMTRGDYVCVMTNNGNVSTVQIVDMSFTNPGRLMLAFSTRR